MYRKFQLINKLAFFSITLMLSKQASAQFNLSGEIRPRAEFRNGFKTVNTAASSPAFFVEQRTRLNFGFAKEKLSFKVSLQDIRTWGNTNQIYKTDPSLLNVFEAYGEYQFNKNFSMKVGRQALSYDNERFLGTLDWAQQSRSHDLLKFSYKDSLGFSMDAGAAFNQNIGVEPTKLSSTFYSGTGNYKTMQYLWLHKDYKGGKVSFLFLNDGRQNLDSTTAFKQTLGLYAEQALGKLALHEEAYYQTGKTTASKDVSAYLLSFSAALPKTFAAPELGVDYLSGTKSTSTKENAFDPAFGTNHKFYGFMDYFYVGNGFGQGGRTTGLIDIYLNTKFKTGAKSLILLNIHQFNSPVDVFAGTTKLPSSLGQEVDAVYNLNIYTGVNLKLGYSQLFSTKTMDAIKGATNKGPNQWAWTMLTFSPKFI
ncbi:alginate export family protein [Pedobacter sp. SD-b]|uniref:Alginate export family protein n=1 Tax=Pedobacter segetis TaxID=2793069 RepID=A0ABS1BNK0_9SPHI|nr:alginate export family protein [Pedobacter segetis]MBK0384470.1 alginate export family protein [Pedobacter segetis]